MVGALAQQLHIRERRAVNMEQWGNTKKTCLKFGPVQSDTSLGNWFLLRKLRINLRHKKYIVSGLLLFLSSSLLFIYENCAPSTNVFSVVSTGNPMQETGSRKVLLAVCSLLTNCNSNLTQSSCESGIISTSGLAEAMGASAGSYTNYGDFMSHEYMGLITGNSAAVDMCVPIIKNLSCSSSLVTSAYNPSSSVPFAGVAAILSDKTNYCYGAYTPPIVVAGTFQDSAATKFSYLAGLNNDGSLVPNYYNKSAEAVSTANTRFLFNPFPAAQYNLLVHDGNSGVLVGGGFENLGGQPIKYLARLTNSANTTPSITFDPFHGYDSQGYISALKRSPDGKIYYGGYLKKGSSSVEYLGRLNPDGSHDSTFQIQGTGFDAVIRDIAIDSSGRIVVVGYFTNYNGQARGGVARLNSDGTLDTSFTTPGIGVGGYAMAVKLDSNGKILVAGWFTCYGTGPGTTGQDIVRLNTDGTLDTAFNPPKLADNVSINIFNSPAFTAAVDNLDRVLLGGRFVSTQLYLSGLGRMKSTDGYSDTTFSKGGGQLGNVYKITIDSVQRILVAGEFSQYFTGNVPLKGITRLNSDGTLDPTFDFNKAADSICGSSTCSDWAGVEISSKP